MRVLFIGGTGTISSACSELAIERGIELIHFNRGQSPGNVNGVQLIRGDIRNTGDAEKALQGMTFDAVVDWIAFTPDHVETDIQLFQGRTSQYIFISSATVYKKPPDRWPIKEDCPLGNSFWQYARDKILCENRLRQAHRLDGFPVTVVRPTFTYDKRTIPALPVRAGYTVLNRMKRGKKVIVPGDGTSLWVLTHHRDFAVGLVGLLGNEAALGEAFHITSDEWLTWDLIYETLGEALGARPDILHVPSDLIAGYDSAWGDTLLGDKAYSTVFDNSKIKRAVPDFRAEIPFSRGAEEIIRWYEEDASRQVTDQARDKLMDDIVSSMERAAPIRS